ncbi:hypothetical protein I4U23_011039 [Adineta vaga]|nr:hypothetical protein I4U23_011039 [Adineta vaga]
MSKATDKLIKLVESKTGELDSSSKAQKYLQEGAAITARTEIDQLRNDERFRRVYTKPQNALRNYQWFCVKDSKLIKFSTRCAELREGFEMNIKPMKFGLTPFVLECICIDYICGSCIAHIHIGLSIRVRGGH